MMTIIIWLCFIVGITSLILMCIFTYFVIVGDINNKFMKIMSMNVKEIFKNKKK